MGYSVIKPFITCYCGNDSLTFNTEEKIMNNSLRRNSTTILRIIIVAMAMLLVAGLIQINAKEKSKAEQQQDIQKMAKETLDRLYKLNPDARTSIAKSAGYAVFSNYGFTFIFVGGGGGKGLAVDNETKKTTYMKMWEAQAGLGLGGKKFSVIFAFETLKKFEHFVNEGWDFGGQATAAAQTSTKGGAYQGAVSVSPGIWVYQLTDKGLALEIMAKGTKYYKDNDLN